MNIRNNSASISTNDDTILELEKEVQLLTGELEELKSELSELQVKGNQAHNSIIKYRELIEESKIKLSNIKRKQRRLIRKYEPDKINSYIYEMKTSG